MISLTALAVFCSLYMGLERPHFTIAQAIIESGANPKAVGKVGEKGAWQVQERYWGKVPKRFKAQAHQAENIYNILLEEERGDVRAATKRYNGIGYEADVYTNKVISKTIQLAYWDF